MIEWDEISEPEFLDMLEDLYLSQGYSVDNLHNRRELGADLFAAKEDEQVVILGKINPNQSDLSQPPLAQQNYPTATRYIYYYAGEASAPFSSVMQSTYSDFELRNEDVTEREMFNSNSVFIFRFLVKYSLAITRMAKLIQKAYTIEEAEESDAAVNRALIPTLFSAYEGIVQIREINKMAIDTLRIPLDKYEDYNNENLIQEMKQLAEIFISRMAEVSNKLNDFLELDSPSVYRFFQGPSVYGATLSGFFLPVDLTTGNWGRYSNRNQKRHYYKILDFMVCGFREHSPHYLWGVTEVVGCFLCLEDVLAGLKRSSRRLIDSVFESS